MPSLHFLAHEDLTPREEEGHVERHIPHSLHIYKVTPEEDKLVMLLLSKETNLQHHFPQQFDIWLPVDILGEMVIISYCEGPSSFGEFRHKLLQKDLRGIEFGETKILHGGVLSDDIVIIGVSVRRYIT